MSLSSPSNTKKYFTIISLAPISPYNTLAAGLRTFNFTSISFPHIREQWVEETVEDFEDEDEAAVAAVDEATVAVDLIAVEEVVDEGCPVGAC